MLYSSAVKLVALAASLLAAAPLASAELRQGPTGVEYVKRFEPSPGVNGCYYTCPTTYTRSGGNGNIRLSSPLRGSNAGNGVTLCEYYNGVSASTFVDCYYDANNQLDPESSGIFGNSAPGETLNCPTSADRSPSCPNDVKRELSALEKVVKSRQYDLKRAKRRSSKRR